ncbi:DgyrCDS5346 [Dimorphilus gyrociliatus]|nr:DgyrCDS5346 [Dimorphilus gyrociliatus]
MQNDFEGVSKRMNDLKVNENNNESKNAERPGMKFKALASYKRNLGSPIGDEINLQGNILYTFVSKHPNCEGWWKVTNEEGACGYVPGNRLTPYKKPTTLPWLENKREEQANETPFFGALPPKATPYVPTYNHKGLTELAANKGPETYYCEICDKQLNGPRPFTAHLASRGHKEEVELRAIYGN